MPGLDCFRGYSSKPQQDLREERLEGIGDWLGPATSRTASRNIVHSIRHAHLLAKLKLKSQSEWRAFCRGEMPQLGQLPADIPANPNQTYANKGWKSMGDWLGTGRIATHLQTIPFIP